MYVFVVRLFEWLFALAHVLRIQKINFQAIRSCPCCEKKSPEVFEKSLTAMVKGIRAHRGSETENRFFWGGAAWRITPLSK